MSKKCPKHYEQLPPGNNGTKCIRFFNLTEWDFGAARKFCKPYDLFQDAPASAKFDFAAAAAFDKLYMAMMDDNFSNLPVVKSSLPACTDLENQAQRKEYFALRMMNKQSTFTQKCGSPTSSNPYSCTTDLK
jgi:hypothetical protein